MGRARRLQACGSVGSRHGERQGSPSVLRVNIPVSDSGFTCRTVEDLVQGVATSDGAGVRLTRVLTPPLQRRLDPFLMLDAFRNEHPYDYMGGFPDHPHRGFETVTYVIAGRMRHHDNVGNEWGLGPGGAQWMTAGSGLVHSELPEQEAGLRHGHSGQ